MPIDITKHCIFTPKPKAPPTGQDPPMGPNVGFLTTASPNVIIGGIPMPSLLSFAMGAALKGLGGLAKAVARRPAAAFSRFAQKVGRRLGKNMKPGFIKCTLLRAEPVHVVTGEVVVDQQDFELPGRIPIRWTRHYRSSSERAGACGYGWETPADARLELGPEGDATFMDGTGVAACFPTLPAQEPVLELVDGARLQRTDDHYVVRLKSGLSYYFPIPHGPVAEVLVTAVVDTCRNSLHFVRDQHGLKEVVESAGRRLEVRSRDGLIREIWLHHPEFPERRLLVRYDHDPGRDLVCVYDALDAPYRFAYQNHRMVRHTNRNGLSFYYEYDRPAPDGRVLHTWGDGGLYDYRFGYNPVERWTEFTNSLGHTSRIEYDPRLLITRERDPLGGTTHFSYDDRGRTTQVVDPMGHATAYEYDERGNLLKLTRPDGKTLEAEFDAADKAVAITDPNGARWKQKWDARGLLVEHTTPRGHISRYVYDAPGELAAFTNPRGARTELAFDGAGNVVSFRDALGYSSAFAYDALGNVTRKLDPLNNETLYRYDAKGQLIYARLPSGATIACSYDPEGNLTRYVDANGAETKLEYVGLSELARRIQPDGYSIEYQYDTEERLIGVTNQRGETYRLQRDALGRIVAEVDYWGQVRNYHYTACGYLTESVDPLGRIIHYHNDPLGRILKKVLYDPAQPEAAQTESFEYDPNGNLVACANAAISISRQYDPEGRLLEEKQGPGCVVRNAYDATGNRITRTTTREIAGRRHVLTVQYAYDALDQTTRVEVEGYAPIEFARNALGQLTEERLGALVRRRLDYSADGYLTAQRMLVAGHPLLEQGYRYDSVGNPIVKRDSAYGIDQYTYDPVGRLTAHLDPQGRRRPYLNDPAGDRLPTLRAHEPVSEPGQDVEWRREGECGGILYRFDRAGNLIERTGAEGGTQFAWDANQRLNGITTGGTTTTYRYDPLGRRVWKQTSDTTVHFCWDGDLLLGDASVTEGLDERPILRLVREWVPYPNTFELLALVQCSNNAAQSDLYYYHNDPNGCPTRLLDATGNVVWAALYGGWGRVEQLALNRVNNPIRLQGQYEDSETGLHYNRYRYYDASIGHFISPDPIGLQGGLQLYISIPNSLSWIDPLGLDCNLPKALKKQFRRIEELAQTPGNTGIRAALSPRELRRLGEEFVGEGYTVTRGARHGELWLISADGKRMFRSPTPKSSPYARTGKQANFHQRNNINQNWFDEGTVSNVHVHAH
jgi:RHS repeat-associated protein